VLTSDYDPAGDLPPADRDLLVLGSPPEVAAYQAEQLGQDLVRIVCTNVRTGRELTAWLRVPLPSGTELQSRCDEIEVACEYTLPEPARHLLRRYRTPAALAANRAYAPERFVLAVALNRVRLGRQGIAAGRKNDEYDHYKERLTHALVIEKRSAAEMVMLRHELCDQYVDEKCGPAQSQNAAARERARDAFNQAMKRYLRQLPQPPE
jgi:hypothetical protein